MLDETGWNDRVAIAGSSHGGVVALELAARGRAASVIALAPPWVESAASAALFPAVFLPMQATMRLTDRFHPRFARWAPYGGLYFHGSRQPAVIAPEDLVASIRSFARFPLLRVMRQDGLAGRRMPDLPAVDCPVALVRGTRDWAVPMWMHRRWAAALPGADTILLEGLPHCPHLRDPERVARLLLLDPAEYHEASAPPGL